MQQRLGVYVGAKASSCSRASGANISENISSRSISSVLYFICGLTKS
jgi:hypothetical protein